MSANVELFRTFLPYMRKKQWGRVIFSSSASTICASATDRMSMYVATKGALTRSPRRQLQKQGPMASRSTAWCWGCSIPILFAKRSH